MQGSQFYPRALLEVLVSDLCPGFDLSRSSHRKRLRKAKSDYDYVRAACNELGLSDMVRIVSAKNQAFMVEGTA